MYTIVRGTKIDRGNSIWRIRILGMGEGISIKAIMEEIIINDLHIMMVGK